MSFYILLLNHPSHSHRGVVTKLLWFWVWLHFLFNSVLSYSARCALCVFSSCVWKSKETRMCCAALRPSSNGVHFAHKHVHTGHIFYLRSAALYTFLFFSSWHTRSHTLTRWRGLFTVPLALRIRARPAICPLLQMLRMLSALLPAGTRHRSSTKSQTFYLHQPTFSGFFFRPDAVFFFFFFSMPK